MKNEEMIKKCLDVQENERQRIARELHDSSLQNLTHITHRIELAQLYMNTDTIKAKLELSGVNKELKEIIQDIRDTIFELRPMSIDDLGMKDTIIRFVQNLQNKSDINISYQIDDMTDMSQHILLDIYRIVQECVNNAVKHAQCKNINIKMHDLIEKLEIEIIDDGIGFDYENKKKNNNGHFGLKIVEERVNICRGKMMVNSSIETGTKIIIKIPKMKQQDKEE